MSFEAAPFVAFLLGLFLGGLSVGWIDYGYKILTHKEF